MVEPNVVGGWDVRPEATTTRHSRHSTRDDAVEVARALGEESGEDIVVLGLKGQVLARYPPDGAPDSARSAAAPPASTGPAAPPATASPSPVPAAPTQPASPAGTGSPTRRPGMRIGQLLALSDQTDADGRLLLEDSAPEAAIRKAKQAGIPMESGPAPYQDTPSRYGGRMNVSAYEALRHDVAGILNGFAWLAEHAAAALAPEPLPATPRRLFVTSYLGVSLAHVLFHRAVDPVPPHGQLPPYVASIFKASRGIFSFSVQLENDLGSDHPMTAADVMTYAEEHRQLVRPETGEVCAAPTRLIERTIEAILISEGADAAKSTIGDLVDFPMLWDFYRLQDEVGIVLSAFRVVLNQVSAIAQSGDPNRLFSARIPTGPAQGRPFGQFTGEVLATITEAQAGMNRALGRAENARAVTPEDLLRML